MVQFFVHLRLDDDLVRRRHQHQAHHTGFFACVTEATRRPLHAHGVRVAVLARPIIFEFQMHVKVTFLVVLGLEQNVDGLVV